MMPKIKEIKQTAPDEKKVEDLSEDDSSVYEEDDESEESDEAEDDDSESENEVDNRNQHFDLTGQQIDDDNSSDEEEDEENLSDEADEGVDLDVGSAGEEEDPSAPRTGVNQVRHNVDPQKQSKNVANVNEYEHGDSSDEEDMRNTIGNVPVEWYNEYEHIGYDWNASKIIKPKKDNEVDDFVKRIEDPLYWRTVRDKLTGQSVVLTDNDVGLINRLKKSDYPDPNFNPYDDFFDLHTYETMIHPMTNRPMPKAMFIPSISEKRAISKLVSKIKRSWQLPKVEKKKDKQFRFDYDLWEKDGDVNNRRMQRHITAPKMALPGHEESYNPPPEFLLTPEEEAKWKEKDPEERKLNFLPQKFGALRHVPAYKTFVKERFERCLDLYLCPRARKMRANVNPEDLIPKLPKPKDLQPFPCLESLVYVGHEAIVRSIAVEPKGQFMASGSDDGTVKVWEIITGRCLKTIELGEAVKFIAWCPDETKCLLAVAVAKEVFIINPSVGDKLVISNTDLTFKDGEDGTNDGATTSKAAAKPTEAVTWQIISDNSGTDPLWNKGIRVSIKHRFEIKQLTWHSRGDYFASVMPTGGNKSVVIHQLSKRRSQVPFSKSKGLIQCVLFHPTRPYFFVATQRYVRIYNLMKQQLSKKLMTNCKYVSSMAIHPGGDNVIVGSYDLRLSWFDLDLSNKPYKTLRYHKKAVRSVAYHPKYPLFASASDDGTVIISHGMVYSDLLQNPLIVPVKVLRGHKVTEDLGVLDCCFHPQQPWVFSAGADATIRLFT